MEAQVYTQVEDRELIKLGPGQTFGDFSEATGKKYKPQQVIVMSETLKCIMINVKDL